MTNTERPIIEITQGLKVHAMDKKSTRDKHQKDKKSEQLTLIYYIYKGYLYYKTTTFIAVIRGNGYLALSEFTLRATKTHTATEHTQHQRTSDTQQLNVIFTLYERATLTLNQTTV